MELRMYEYRLYPSAKQKIRLLNNFKICKEIYNTLLSLNKKLWTTKKFDFDSIIKDIKLCCPEYYSQAHSQVLQNISDRLSKAFDNFFRRLKDPTCKKKGFPRFKSRIRSITFPQSGFKMLSDRRLSCSKIGSMQIILSRVPKGKVKTLTIKCNRANQWFAVFSCEVDFPAVKHQSTNKVGIDVGLETFATFSNGEVVSNPRHLIKSEKKIAVLQRRLSRKKKCSANRRNARLKLARQHLKVANQRKDFLHKLSRRIVNAYSIVAVENLNISEMLHNNPLARFISDASWGAFIRNLEYKAITSGSELVKVNPAMTSMTCSKCGTVMDMPLKIRQFSCPKCDFVCHRDLNASYNILKVGTDCAKLNACGDSASTLLFGKASGIVEAGTTYGK